jgi:lyso-ornithine lipid O-acyltransferase
MKKIYKLFFFLLYIFFYFSVAAAINIVFFRQHINRKKSLAHLIQKWSKAVNRLLNIRIDVHYKFPFHQKNFLIVGNHQSYLDITIIASIFPTLFVAKKEVEEWFFIGRLVKFGGTIFINRNSFMNGYRISDEIGKTIKDEINVQIFPEGTSSDGSTIFPFKPILLKSAIDTNIPALPVSINYDCINLKKFSETNRDIVCWYGNMNFINHFLNLLSQDSVDVTVVIHQPMIQTCGMKPQELALKLHSIISSEFQSLQ